ncbi:hypothetical protein EV178_003087 [Coemansia sp. RSA 1646]|nr:hypothetical protein EV178_003087 [Coemansia sp. RSA 1646]KAJ2089431.1 hypothetical protein IW138_003461 [Coemansia sp. RSA 986]
MGISTRTRARRSDSVTEEAVAHQQQPLQELGAATLNSNSSRVDQTTGKDTMPSSDSVDESGTNPGATVETSTQNIEPHMPGGSNGDSVRIPASNIRQFKEAVVNTSKLLKVFSDQEKELSKAKAEISKFHEEAKRTQASYQTLQHDADSRTRELARSNAELENARSLLVQREKELSRVRGLKEDLEAKILELKLAEPVVNHSVPPKSPNALVLEEIEKLKKELEAKEGSLKSLRISRDSIRSSTRAEIMSIQARYAREQKELIERQETEMTRHRQSLAAKETELEQEQERLMQLEMDVSMRSTQLEDQAVELKTSLDDITSKYDAAREAIKRLEGQNKARNAEHRSEVAKLNRAAKKDEKRIAELESAFEKVKAQAKENAKAARENERIRGKSRPRSTATAAEAVSAATEDVANMDIEELREEVATLRVDAVHKDETIRKLGVMVEELERKQNPEGRRPRARVSAMQTEIDELKAELDVRSKKIEALEKVLHFSDGAQNNLSNSSDKDMDTSADPAAAIAQLELKVIALEMGIKERDGKIESLDKELKEAQEMTSERPMRLRHSSAGLSPSAHTPKSTATAGTTSAYGQQNALPRSVAAGLYGSPANSKRRSSTRADSRAHEDPSESLYAEAAELRAKVNKMQHEKAALLELVTDQQVAIHELRSSSSVQRLSGGTALSSPTQTHQKQILARPSALVLSPVIDSDESRFVPAKRPRHSTKSDEGESSSMQILASGSGLAKAAMSSQSKRPASLAVPDTPKQGGRQAVGKDVDSETMERLLKDKRISSVNRAKRLFSHLQKAPHALQQALLQMQDGGVPSIDAAEFVRAIVSFITSLATKAGTDIMVYPSENEYTSSPSNTTDDSDLLSLSDVVVRGLYETEVHIATSIWTVSIKNSQDQFFDGLMQLLAQKTVAPTTRSVAAVCSLARIFAALCLLAADIQRVRIMLCDLLMDAVDSPHTLPVLSNVLAVCPDALRMPQEDESSHDGAEDRSAFRLVVRVFQAIVSGIHDLYSEEHSTAEADALYSIMVERCGWRHPSDAEFADKVFVETSNKLASLEHTSRSYPVVMCAYNLLAPYVAPS